MGNYIIAQPYLATITAASAAASMPATNLNKVQPSDVWRSTSLSSQYIEIDLGGAKAVNLAALLFTNLTSAATIRIRAATSQANLTAAPGYDPGTTNPAWAGATQNVDRPHTLSFLAAAQTYRWWRFDLTDAANPAGYFEAGRVFLANAFQGTRNYSYGAGRGFNDLSTVKDGFGGQQLIENKGKRPVLSFEAAWLTAAEQETMLEIERNAVDAQLLMLNPDAAATRMGAMYYGKTRFEALINASFTRYGTRFTVEGLI